MGETTLTATAATEAGGTGTLTVNVEVTPMRITYGSPDQTNSEDGRPYIVYALNEDGTTPKFSDLLGFYPVKAGSQEGTYEADTDKPKITLTPGMGDTDDAYYVYENDVSGNVIATGSLPAHPTVDGDGNPHSIRVEFKLRNPNYAFCTVGTNWQPSDTIIIYVTCYENGMNEVDLYLEGDTKPLETFEGDHEYEYTGEGIVPTTRDLTTLYTRGKNTDYSITQFTAHFHAVTEDTAFSGTHLTQVENTGLTADALKGIAPTELGVYSFVINGYNKDTKTYCYASRRYSIVKGNPQVEFGSVSTGAALSSVPVTVKNAAGLEVTGTITWNGDNQTVERGKSYAWTFTPNDTEHYNTVNGETVLLRASSGGGSSSSSSSSAVSVDSGKNGSVTVSPKSAKKGDTVTVTVKPDKGYEVDEIIVTDKNGDELKVTRKSDTKYTFTMPSGKVTVEASFVEIENTPDEGLPFVDVPANAYYADAVAWAVEQGITSGTSATTFSPDASCTRAQMVTFLWRAAGSPKAAGSNPFSDLDASAYYYDAVLWAVKQGITSGTSATTFGPDATVTRGQTVTFLYRASGSPAVSGNSFADVSADAYYADAVAWAVAEGITSGTGDNMFSPNADCTRGQIVTFLYRDAT